MNLYILRHAIAADKAEWKGSDSDRPLTKVGIKKMRKAAKGMRRLGLKIDWILTSPYRRAYDTAMIAAKELKLKDKLKISKSLAVDGDPKTLVRRLALGFLSRESVLLVGHEPYLSQLIGVLIWGLSPRPQDTGGSHSSIELDKGGLAKLSADSLTYDKCATLEWLLTSKILKKLI